MFCLLRGGAQGTYSVVDCIVKLNCVEYLFANKEFLFKALSIDTYGCYDRKATATVLRSVSYYPNQNFRMELINLKIAQKSLRCFDFIKRTGWAIHFPPIVFKTSKSGQKHKANPVLKDYILQASLAGPQHFRGMNMTAEEFEFLIGKTGAVQTDIKKDPRPKVKDVMMSSLRGNQNHDDSSDNDDW